MDNIKNDAYYLGKILADLGFMMEHTNGKTMDEIEKDALLLDSIMFRLIQISENSDKLTLEFKNNHKELPWRSIKGMRNRIVHDYGFIDMAIIYDTVMNSIPELYNAIKECI